MKHLINIFSGEALTTCGLMAAIPSEITTDVDCRNCPDCRESMIRGGHCPACGEQKLSWGVHPENRSGVVDGRLTARDVKTIFYLACDYCSETVLPRVDPEDVAAALTKMGWIPA